MIDSCFIFSVPFTFDALVVVLSTHRSTPVTSVLVVTVLSLLHRDQTHSYDVIV
jgi:hypothetical protein